MIEGRMLGKRSLPRPKSRMQDTLIILLLLETGFFISPPLGMKDPWNKDVLEDGISENLQRAAINCRF